MGKKKLIVHDVNKSFVVNGQSVDVLKDINLEIEEGEFVVIVGHSGCGKSTLLKMIAGYRNLECRWKRNRWTRNGQRNDFPGT